MKKLNILIILPVAIFFFSCNANNGSKSRENSIADAAASNISSAPEAIFSYLLDGVKISGGEVDALMMNNAAFETGSGADSKKLSFFLNDAYRDDKETFSHSLRFAIPDKSVTTTLVPDEDHWNVQLFLATGEEGKYVLYANESFAVTVSDRSATRVSGTFSGKLKIVKETGTGKEELTVTDGKFNIPVRHPQQ